ncbi:VOC family protein [Mameliella sediminis]|uniref:VOC family protein n=1 Tax=Mameliella sediminis TaxID=2836866 RepID=UPI001C490E84|nr:VOC family protein [Mameliella sediminis]MBY6113508.1 VOC family protein [Antarctobacter heliothermus]MBY6143144.1 VOC family protein [Mameliella alba]MBV7394806.1 VOC family protein [Mameliella sediminis]MBY6159999.1 VOC family protein [Mameliella alba]MBY6168470.1 VOC family protein [Mameliella alba]
MPLTAFDHVNVRTGQLDKMIAWYGEILGLHPGPRPPFGFGGAWLYLGEQAYVHLVEVKDQPPAVPKATLEHFAFRAAGMTEFLAKLEAAQLPYSVDEVPGFPIVQVNFHDPDGNHIHVDFDKAERQD